MPRIEIGDFTIQTSEVRGHKTPYILHKDGYLTKNKTIERPGGNLTDFSPFYYGNMGAAVSAVLAHYRRGGLPVPSYK